MSQLLFNISSLPQFSVLLLFFSHLVHFCLFDSIFCTHLFPSMSFPFYCKFCYISPSCYLPTRPPHSLLNSQVKIFIPIHTERAEAAAAGAAGVNAFKVAGPLSVQWEEEEEEEDGQRCWEVSESRWKRDMHCDMRKKGAVRRWAPPSYQTHVILSAAETHQWQFILNNSVTVVVWDGIFIRTVLRPTPIKTVLLVYMFLCHFVW